MNQDEVNNLNPKSPTEFFDQFFAPENRITIYANDPTGKRENFYLCFEIKSLNNDKTSKILDSISAEGFELYLDLSDFRKTGGDDIPLAFSPLN